MMKSLYEITRRLNLAQIGFQTRWYKFCRMHKHLTPWATNVNEEFLKEQFIQMKRERWNAYFTNPQDCGKPGAIGSYKDDYKIPSQEIFKTWFSRNPYPTVTFSYNLAYPYYNASIVTINGLTFLAMEAPSLSSFFSTIEAYKANALVRLTAAYEEGKENCTPYWEGRTRLKENTNQEVIKISNREVPYFHTDTWLNHSAIEVNELLTLVNKVRTGET